MAKKKSVLTTEDLDAIGKLIDQRLEPMATKEFVRDLINDAINIDVRQMIKEANTELKIELKSYIDEGIETVLAGIDSLHTEYKSMQKHRS